MILSRKAKEAIKTALAMTIAYGIALASGWDKPMWAGFAVAFTSLATVGQSFNKASLRMFGTLVGAAAALTLIAFFAQERWPFMMALSIYIGFCCYMMGGAKNKYFWHVSGFVCVIICMDAGPNGLNAFNLAMLRTQETGLGILVYSVVSLLLWPVSSGSQLQNVTVTLASAQRQLLASLTEEMKGSESSTDVQELTTQLVGVQAQFGQLLEAAIIDTADVGLVRQHWRRYQECAVAMTETMARLHENLAAAQGMNIPRLVHKFEELCDELGARLNETECMLAHKVAQRYPVRLDVELATSETNHLSHFDKAAIVVIQVRLQKLETLSMTMFQTVSDIQNCAKGENVSSPPKVGFVFDQERFLAVLRIMLTLWVAYFVLIYVDSVPGGSVLVSVATSIGMVLVFMPQVSASILLKPVFSSILCSSLVYFFIMPQLSSFIELGVVIFSATFVICYFFAEPKDMLSRAVGLALFLTITSISNQQSYSFMAVVNTALMFCILILLLIFTAYIPFSPRPEKTFLRLLRRYFQSSRALMSSIHQSSGRSMTRLERWRYEYHVHEVLTLPGKIGGWARGIDPKVVPGTSPELVQNVGASLTLLSNHIQELLEEHGSPQSPILTEAMHTDFLNWHILVQEVFQHLAMSSAVGEPETFRADLRDVMKNIDQQLRTVLEKSTEGQFTAQDGENFYRLLGAYRGVSEALIDYAGSTAAIDWSSWSEERF